MLYIVPTPIGNLGDMTYRAVETLKSVDKIACEDTRHSLKLLNHFEIKKPLVSFHKFNTQKMLPSLLDELKRGANIALISDAGMPCISDPGAELVKACIDETIPYTVLPGATALINAVILSGRSDGKFMFVGFLPSKNSERKQLLTGLVGITCPMIFYISPHSLNEDIESIYKVFGDRNFATVREISKLYETVEFSTLEKGYTGEPRGEYVLVVDGCEPRNVLNDLDIKSHISHYEARGLDRMSAIKQVASDRGVAKSVIYKSSLD